MEKLPNIDLLNEAITVAEKVLEDIENEDNFKANRKRKRINNALENAYATLNKKEYTEKEIKDRTDEVWNSLVDKDPVAIFFLFLIGFSLSGIVIFTVYQTYSFLNKHLDPDPESHYPVLTEETSSKIKVNYIETDVVSLYNQMSISDSEGLKKDPKKFTISNSSKEIGKSNYFVKYFVNIVPLNDPNANLLNEEHIKLKYTYTDFNGEYRESEIMTLADLHKNQDGTFTLTEGNQKMDKSTDFEVYIWISAHATNEEMGATYTFKFKVDAAIGQL